MKELLIVYLIIINIISFAACCADKAFAKKKMRRISENALLILSAVGGSVGMIAGMYTVRHKTRKPKFTVSVPVMLILQTAAVYWLLTKLV